MDLIDDELRRLCRLCAEPGQNMINLFIVKRNGLILSEMLSFYTQQQMEQTDTMPSKICLNCINRLSSAHEFFTLVKTSQVKFQGMIDAARLALEIGEKCDLENSSIEVMENAYIGHVSPKASSIESPIVIKDNFVETDPLSLTVQTEPAEQNTEQNTEQLHDPLGSNEVYKFVNSADCLQPTATKQLKQQKRKSVRTKKNIDVHVPKSSHRYFCLMHTKNSTKPIYC